MRHILVVLLLALGAGEARTQGLVEEVHRLPDLSRRALAGAIRRILEKKGATLDALVQACRAFPFKGKLVPGLHPVPPGTLVISKGLEPGTRGPLLVVIPATGQSDKEAARFWAEKIRFPALILAPKPAVPGRAWTFSKEDREVILEAHRWALAHLPVDPDRVFLAGYSRGGHGAWGIALRHPDPFAAVIAVAGGPRLAWTQDQNNIRFLKNLAGTPLLAMVGGKDDPYLVWNVREACARLKSWGSPVTLILKESEGHALFVEGREISKWLEGKKRPSSPKKVFLACSGPARRAWISVSRLDRRFTAPLRPAFRASFWRSLTKEQQRKRIVDFSLAHTAWIAGEIPGPGMVRISAEGVRRFRLLAGPDNPLGDAKGNLLVQVGRKKPVRRRLHPSRQVLLREWAKNPDPSRLVWAHLDMSAR